MSDAFVGSVRLFHASGVQVTLPLGKTQQEYAGLYASVDAMIGAGFLTAEPGMQVGENKDTIGFVVRKEKINERGVTPSLDLYINHEKMVRSFITIYLNTPEDIAAFENASGLKLDSIRLYAGDDKLDRSTPKGGQFAKACARPFEIVWIPNPKYNEAEAAAAKAVNQNYFVPTKKFVRYGGSVAASTAPTPSANGQPSTSQFRNAPPAPQPQGNAGGVGYNKLYADLNNVTNDDQFNASVVAIRAAWATLNSEQRNNLMDLKESVSLRLQDANDPIPF
jgi:hypothetical protein